MTTDAKQKIDAFLKDVFNQTITNEAVEILRSKLNARGITLTEDQLIKLKSMSLTRLLNDKIEINDEQVPLNLREESKLSIEFNENDGARLQCVGEKLLNDIPHILEDLAEGISKNIYKSYITNGDQIRSAYNQRMAEFEKSVYEKWEEPFSRIELYLQLVFELCSEHMPLPSYKTKVLRHLSAKAFQVSCEIFTLLKAGHGPGADARWRTLHEISVVAIFISKHGDDLAEKFLDFDVVESYKAAKQYQEKCERLGYDPIDAHEMQKIEDGYSAIIKKHGKEFKGSYGWAATHVQKDDPNFADIEKAIDLDHWRPFYKLASFNLHAGPKILDSIMGAQGLVAGPNSNNLADPGINMAISLMRVAITYLVPGPETDASAEDIVKMKLIARFVEEIQKSFVARIEAEDMSGSE